jgi:heat shock protein 4
MEETKERKNALEAYVLAMRSRLGDVLAPYAGEALRASFGDLLSKAEDWLYDEGEDQSKGVYTTKMEELKAIGDPIEARLKEEAEREPAATKLRTSAEAARNQSKQPHYAHIAADQLELVRKEADGALAWLAVKEALQAGLAKSDTPAFNAKDCLQKAETLERFVRPIFATPKPIVVAEPMAEDGPAAPAAEDLD